MRKRIPIEVNEKALRHELKMLEGILFQGTEIVARMEDKVKDEVAFAKKKSMKFDEDWRQLWSKIGIMKRQVNLQVCEELYGRSVPFYTTGRYGYGIETNIHADVIEAIKLTVGISKLKHSQVEDVVRKIIEQRLARNEEYRALLKKRNEMRGNTLLGHFQ